MEHENVEFFKVDNHDVYIHSNHIVVICPVVDEIIGVEAKRGTITHFCPGCGKELKKEVN